MKRIFLIVYLMDALLLPVMAGAQGRRGDLIAPYVTTPPAVMNVMLKLAGVSPRDTLYDLGCGDGRFVIAAAQKFGARSIGVDLDPNLVQLARENAAAAGVDSLATFMVGDFLRMDLSPATVVTAYLTQSAMQILRPVLERNLKPGTRVVSHNYSINGWQPDSVKYVEANDGLEHIVYLWTVKKQAPPEKKGPPVFLK